MSELVFPSPTDLPDVVSGEEAGGEICWFVFGKDCVRGIWLFVSGIENALCNESSELCLLAGLALLETGTMDDEAGALLTE